MEKWKSDLGAHCTTCHTVSSNPNNLNSNGFPEVEPYNNSLPAYKAAERMVQMTAEMNQKYFSTAKTPITCGACHRGKLVPEAFVGTVAGNGLREGMPATNGK
jgi:nitrate/TMAO reductase-like tetraheme cytochrome c subunit